MRRPPSLKGDPSRLLLPQNHGINVAGVQFGLDLEEEYGDLVDCDCDELDQPQFKLP
jgi:hypothetical protein